MLDSDLNRVNVVRFFPGLKNDSSSKVTSNQSPNYNCIAWAGLQDEEWWQPGISANLEGVKYRWPPDLPIDNVLRNYIELFRKLNYFEESINHNIEQGVLKVALYVKKDLKNLKLPLLEKECTHAARQLSSGLWTSKLGQFFDIYHSDPYSIEGDSYGEVGIILKRKYP